MSMSGRIAHRLWQALPRGLRRRLAFGLGHALAPRPANLKLREGSPITIAGFLETPTGIGQSARAMRDALTALGHDVRTHSFSGSLMQPQSLPRAETRAPDWRRNGALIVHVNPPLLSLAMARLGNRIRHQRVIGYWAWELPSLPADWKSGFALVDEIWCPSEFTAAAIRAETEKPVHVVPHYVPESEAPEPAREGSSFRVFTAFDMGSSFARKNPQAAIAAFRRAFPGGENARLVVKVSNPQMHPESMAALREAAAGDDRIAFLSESLSPRAMQSLIAHSDAVISLHRSEGFGLLLAEAMALGVPTIATAWSGNLDFMHEGNSLLVPARLVPAEDAQHHYHFPEMRWAEADVEAAATALARLFAEPALRAQLGRAGRETVRAALSLDRLRMIYGARLYLR